MRNILVKTAVTAVCLYTAAKWAKKHIRAGIIIGSPNITSAEIKELIEKRMEGNAGYRSAGDKKDNGSMHETKRCIYFPDGTTRIADGSLAKTKVSDVHLPGTVKEIGSRAFYRCKDLKRIDLPDGLERIGGDAFNGSGLTEIDVPDSVTEIGEWAFSMCDDLKKAVLPARFANLPNHIFDSCSNLETVIFREAVTADIKQDSPVSIAGE